MIPRAAAVCPTCRTSVGRNGGEGGGKTNKAIKGCFESAREGWKLEAALQRESEQVGVLEEQSDKDSGCREKLTLQRGERKT